MGNGRIYHVPDYQRDYSWKVDNWEDLWLDLIEMEQTAAAQHYMGAIVLKEETPEVFLIIDGQQRLATLSILVLAVVSQLESMADEGQEFEENRERASLLRQSFIGTKDPGSLTETSKLKLNDSNDAFYQGTLIQLDQPASVRALSDSEALLWNAFRYFREKIGTKFAEASGQVLANWINQFVAVRLFFIQVSVESEVSAYTVFETLNARGLELTSSDLIKNYLMALVATKGKGDLNYVLRKWRRISEQIGAKRLPEFLRHYFNSIREYVRQEKLFRKIRESVTDGGSAVKLINELEKAAYCYKALASPDDEFWADFPDASDEVRVLAMFGVSQFKPLALAAVRKLSASDVAIVLRDCVTLSFRFSVISRFGTHELERRYNEAAIAVERNETGPSGVRDILATVYVNDEEFKSDFALFRQPTSNKGKRMIRYILCELERHNSGSDVAWHSTTSTIEHILPERLSAEWENSFSEELHDRCFARIGNYALLEAGKNRDAEQLPFENKSTIYETSQYGLTKELSELPEWTEARLTGRQRRLARLATSVWRFPD
ncbi:MAG: DUF262 domain-containing protein [Planctomycetota bacterium]|nr:DUF262 domain-containing protein [Planctomycetota bacterium]